MRDADCKANNFDRPCNFPRLGLFFAEYLGSFRIWRLLRAAVLATHISLRPFNIVEKPRRLRHLDFQTLFGAQLQGQAGVWRVSQFLDQRLLEQKIHCLHLHLQYFVLKLLELKKLPYSLLQCSDQLQQVHHYLHSRHPYSVLLPQELGQKPFQISGKNSLKVRL